MHQRPALATYSAPFSAPHRHLPSSNSFSDKITISPRQESSSPLSNNKQTLHHSLDITSNSATRIPAPRHLPISRDLLPPSSHEKTFQQRFSTPDDRPQNSRQRIQLFPTTNTMAIRCNRPGLTLPRLQYVFPYVTDR